MVFRKSNTINGRQQKGTSRKNCKVQGTHIQVDYYIQFLTISKARRRLAVMYQLPFGEHLRVQAEDEEDAAEEERHPEQGDAMTSGHFCTLQTHHLQCGRFVPHQCHC